MNEQGPELRPPSLTKMESVSLTTNWALRLYSDHPNDGIYLESDMLGCIVRRSVNRNFTKPGSIRPVTSPSSFEQLVKELNISPAEYRSSSELKEWVRRNKDDRYVPTEVLKAFGFRVDS
jgi:hypothetical protein